MEFKLILAPMLEPNDIAFRNLCKKSGADVCYTGMINPLSKKKLDLEDRPILQLFCNNTKGIREFVKRYDPLVSGWDFNLGCPSTVAKKLKIGSYMQDKLKTIESILKEIRENSKKFFSVKIRKSDYSLDILRIAEKYVDALIIHPRTREQGYSGEPDIEFAELLKSKSIIPIIYSGNVNESNYNLLLRKFDGVMIGREAIGRPEIFSKLKNNRAHYSFKDYLDLAKKYELPFKQIKFQAINFTKRIEKARETRLSLVHSKDIKDIEKIYNI